MSRMTQNFQTPQGLSFKWGDMLSLDLLSLPLSWKKSVKNNVPMKRCLIIILDKKYKASPGQKL